MGRGRSGAPVGAVPSVRIDHDQSGWWTHAIRRHCWPAGHRCAPIDDAVRESAACARREVADSASTSPTWADRTERLPERLSYARYLERLNTEATLPPAPKRVATGGEDGADRGGAKLGETPTAQSEIERRVQTAYQVRLVTPIGRYIDAWM